MGCGIGGTTRYLAKNHGCNVVGLTISGRQVEMARSLTAKEAGISAEGAAPTTFTKLGDGGARFVELDAEKMGDCFSNHPIQTTFDCVWISEAMSHLPDKQLFFQNAHKLLNAGGKLVVADWFKAEDLTSAQMQADIKPIEGQALRRPRWLHSTDLYLKMECFSRLCAPRPNTSSLHSKWAFASTPNLWI